MSVCAKFQLSSWSRSDWKVCCGGSTAYMWGSTAYMGNTWVLSLTQRSCFWVALSWVELSWVTLGFDNYQLGLQLTPSAKCKQLNLQLFNEFVNEKFRLYLKIIQTTNLPTRMTFTAYQITRSRTLFPGTLTHKSIPKQILLKICDTVRRHCVSNK